MSEAPRFGFGSNWSRFVDRHLSDERVAESQEHLLGFLKRSDLSGMRFLDIGCGSGLHSLAAHRAGADVVGFDYDPNSVATAKRVRAWAGEPSNWQIQQGSVLDADFMATLPEADVTYSWGVLHHTGDMWTAIANTCDRVPVGGLLYLALYDYDAVAAGKHSPEYWLDVKQMYVKAGWIERRLMEAYYLWDVDMGRRFKRFPKVMKRIRRNRGRGMAWYTDLKDWIGGWPMEFVKVPEALAFCAERGFESLDVRTGEANAELLFRRTATGPLDGEGAADPDPEGPGR